MFRKNYTCLSDNPEYIEYRGNIDYQRSNRVLKSALGPYTEPLIPKEYTFENLYWSIPDSNYWDYADLKVYKNNKLIATVRKNYHNIEYHYVRQNDTDFLITSEDYQAITIVNLDTGVIKTYGDWDDIKKGFGFCPIYFDWDESVDELIIEGCVWAGPYEYMKTYIPDLNNPDFNTAEFWDEEPEEEEDDDE